MVGNGKSVCRLCLHEGQKDELIFVANNDDLVQKIKECVYIEISEYDILPKTACSSCIQKVFDWSSFKENCTKSNQVLLNSIAKQISSEKNQNLLNEESDNDITKHIIKLEVNEEEVKLSKLFDETRFGIYKCDICSQEFKSCIEYLDHQPHHNGEAVFQCDKCSETFSSRDDLVKHDKNHKRSCPICGKIILKTSMKLHLIKHTDKFMCNQCSSRFNSKASLLQHVITLHTDQKDHICETCGKRFSSKSSMTVHRKSHSDLRLYRCKLCAYAGRTASAIYIHMSTHSQEVCICQVCSKIFKSNRNLNDHLRRVHTTEKKHQCTYCDKKFNDKYKLTLHVRCHTGVRPYSCRLCDKAFIRSDALKEHMATHGDRIWYKCENEKCGRKFASKKGLIRHNCSFMNK